MASRNTNTTMSAIKLGTFTVVSILVTGMLAAIMGSYGFGTQQSYKAVFENASMLVKGDAVRVAGVSVGKVTKVDIHDRKYALVSFKINKDVPITSTSKVEVRFLNLIGNRYLAISPGEDTGKKLPENATMPISQTEPALNLTELFNGFQPLFSALEPDQVNQLSMNIIKVMQGEGGTINSLLSNTSSLTNALADNDELIGSVIDNLTSMLQTVDDHHAQLNELLIQLKDWMTQLANDRNTIGESIANVSDLTETVADLLQRGRPDVAIDVAQAKRVAKLLNKPESKTVLAEVLDRLPTMLEKMTRVGTYGSWYNYYLCDLTLKIKLPELGVIGDILDLIPGMKELKEAMSNVHLKSKAARCR
jgi:phospholipid/cholesterol/gamma-HCH transport system substrate-binding protein